MYQRPRKNIEIIDNFQLFLPNEAILKYENNPLNLLPILSRHTPYFFPLISLGQHLNPFTPSPPLQ